MSSDLVTGDLRSPLKRCSRPPFQTRFSFHTARMGLLGVPGLSLLLPSPRKVPLPMLTPDVSHPTP